MTRVTRWGSVQGVVEGAERTRREGWKGGMERGENGEDGEGRKGGEERRGNSGMRREGKERRREGE